MKSKEFLTENSDWFDKSPGGEKLYFESEVIRMMNEYANEALRIHDVVGRSEQLPRKSKYCVSISPEPCKHKGVCEICSK